MRARPWRGTLMFVAASIAVATATAVRHVDVGAPPEIAARPDVRAQGEPTQGDRSLARDRQVGATPAPSVATRTIVGDVEQIKYGAVQVAVTFVGRTITHVSTLRSPDAHERSREINARATPLLDAEALTAGTAGIDTVTGATYTSEGYRRSLQSVLDRVG